MKSRFLAALPLLALAPATDAALQSAFPWIQPVVFGHLGDGNLHYNVQCPAGSESRQFLADHEEAINRIVYDAVVAHGGSISAEHGVGGLKVDKLGDLDAAIKTMIEPCLRNSS